MTGRPPKENAYFGYLAGVVAEVALTLAIFAAALLIILILERLVK